MRLVTNDDQLAKSDHILFYSPSTARFHFCMYSKSILEKKLFEVMTVRNCGEFTNWTYFYI